MKEIAMAMNCAEAKHLIHLDVGDDLRADEEKPLADHMEQCSDCRSYHAGMSRAMSTLLTLRDDPALGLNNLKYGSVWPLVSREIARRRTSPRVTRKFNMQVVALSVCSLSLAVVTMVQSLSSMRNNQDPTGFMPSQAVFHQPQFLPVSLDSDAVRTRLVPHEAPVSLPQSF